MRRFALVALVVSFAAPTATGSADPQPLPLLGVGYTHFAVAGCSLDGTGILAGYALPGVEATVRSELAAMRAGGVETLRLILWYRNDLPAEPWGVVASTPDGLSPPARENLAAYLRDVQDAGFRRITISLAPSGAESPKWPTYDPAALDEDWRLIEDVHTLAERFGPAETRFDLLNEGVPLTWWSHAAVARVDSYVTTLYGRYVAAFGSADVTVSAFVGGASLDSLLDALLAADEPFPGWFDVHLWTAGRASALRALRAFDGVLSRRGSNASLVVGEAPYEDRETAGAVGQFMETSDRPVDEVLEWPLARGSGCRDESESPPYSVDVYRAALSNPPPPSMRPRLG
jgi:hypothetical protein